VVDERFVLKVPENLEPAGVAPLLCAGITTYSPIRRWGYIQGKKVGVVGLGGLGHMGVKFAHAFGAHVVVFTTSPGKRDDALRLGAQEVIVSTDPEQMQQHAGSFDFILDTVSADHDIEAYLGMLAGGRTAVTDCVIGRSFYSPRSRGNLSLSRKFGCKGYRKMAFFATSAFLAE